MTSIISPAVTCFSLSVLLQKIFSSGADTVQQVGRYHFRVHRYFFERESNYFQRELLAPAAPGGQRSGISETSSIVLSDVGPEEFARFLWVFYNPYV